LPTMSSGKAKLEGVLAVLTVACILSALSCGSGKSNTAASPGVLSGNWQMMLQQSPPSSTAQTESGFLLQTGSSLVGELVLKGQTTCAGLGSVQGNLSGSEVTLTLNQIGQTVTLTGTAASDGSAMAGTYSILANSCGSSSSTGTWTAVPVRQVTGTYLGVFTSGYTGLVYNFAVSVTQGANTGTSVATLSGKMTSNNAPCEESVSISGVVSGTSIVFNFLNSDGSAVGQFQGTTSADAGTLTGTYDYLAEPNVCTGDNGSVSMTQQSSP